jgi:prepilin-type N-terminal cleavage/methylation domain-containing protein
MRQRLMGRLRERDERGMTLIEVVVTVGLTAIVMTMATFIVINVLNETSGEAASIAGVQQAQLAERSFTQYLRSSVSLLSVQPNDLVFTSYTGIASGGSVAPDLPQLQTIEAQLCPTTSKYVDSLEVIYGLPQTGTGSTGLHECIAPSSPTPTTTPIPTGVRLAEAFDILPPAAAGNDIFSYYRFVGNAFKPVTTTYAAANPTKVAAIGITVTFLPPPGGATKGFHTELGTTLQTEIYLRNFTPTS